MSALSYDFYVWLNRNAVQKIERDIFHEDLGTFAHQVSILNRSEKAEHRTPRPRYANRRNVR